MCPYCNQSTGGEHAYNCPLNESNRDIQYGYARSYPSILLLSGQIRTDSIVTALQQISELAETYTTCESGECKDCDLLRLIAKIARQALNKSS
jgi:hypothetical protein